jgi:Hint domain
MTAILAYTLTSVSTTGFTVNVTSIETGSQSSDYYEFRFYKNGGSSLIIYTSYWNPSVGSITTSFSSLTPGTLTYSPGDTFNLNITNTSTSSTLTWPDGNSALNNTVNNTVTVPGGGGGSGVACFVAASNLLTPTGYKSAADIKTRDLLMTADGRKVPVKAFSFTVENANKDSAPFLLPKNSLSPNCPKADLRLSPWHAVQLKQGLWMKPMSAFELGAASP